MKLQNFIKLSLMIVGTGPAWIVGTGPAWAGGTFEKIALVDSFDFGSVYDYESETGTVQILEHVLGTGPTMVLWRNCTGGLMRYPSKEDGSYRTTAPVETIRVPEGRATAGWLRYDREKPDCFAKAMREIAARGLKKGVHWPFEESHWTPYCFGQWNIEHPQFWCVDNFGAPQPSRASLAYPEVVAHKLRLVDELVAQGVDIVYIDLFRNGGWTPRQEYVKPMLERWRKTYPGEAVPEPHDRRWLQLVMEVQQNYFRAMRRRLDKSGRKIELYACICYIGRPVANDYTFTQRSLDWRQLVREKVFDGLVVSGVSPERLERAKDVWAETDKIYREFVGEAKGCNRGVKVFFPVSRYDYHRSGIPSYVRLTKLKTEEVAKRLMDAAAAAGGDGIAMECVDYGNYSPATMKAIREWKE